MSPSAHFDGEKFATIETAYCIKPKRIFSVQKLHDVTLVGVEPTIFGMRTRRPGPLDDRAMFGFDIVPKII